MKKRFMSSLLALAMVFSLLPVPAFAAAAEAVAEPVPGQVTARKELISQLPDADGNWTVKLTVQGNPVTETESSHADVVLVVDNSASMMANTIIRGLDSNRISLAKEVSEYFAEKLLPEGTDNRLAVIGFSGVALCGGADDTGAIRVATGLTDEKDVITENIEKMTAWGTTNYTAALAKAQEILNSRTDEEKENRPAHVIFISDGAPGGLVPVQLANPAFNGQVQAKEMRDAGVTMYAIGIELSIPAFSYLATLASIPVRQHARNVIGRCYDIQLRDILENWAAEITKTSAGTNAVLVDTVDTDKFTVVEGSLVDNGEEVSFDENNEVLTWNVGNIPVVTRTVTFKIYANEGVYGIQIPTNRDVVMDYLDPDGDPVHLDKYVIGDPKVDIPAPGDMGAYTVEYFYEDVPGHYPAEPEITETLPAGLGTVITEVETTAHLKDGYVYDKTEGLPLTVVADTAENLVQVYYALDDNHDIIADKYQITVNYAATAGGTVTVSQEVITLKDAEGNDVQALDAVELAGSKAVADAGFHFVNWTGAGLPAEAVTEADLAGTILTNVVGGAEYTFTAHFADDSGVVQSAYTVEYYYEDVPGHYPAECEESETLPAAVNAVIDTVNTAAHLKEGYVYDKTEGLPLTVVEDASKNLIKVYYALDKNDDNIADKYQIFVTYKATKGGTVSNKEEVVTLKDADGNYVRELDIVELVGSKAKANPGYDFTKWTGDGLPKKWEKKANLAGMELEDVVGGTEYIFTAHFKTESGGGYHKPEDLNTTDHYSYILGYKDGTLRPQSSITRGEVATIFFRLLTDEARDKYWSQTNDYSDVPADLWCNNAISTMANMGIIDGYTDGTFRPSGKITRAQFSKMAVNFFETVEREYAGYFTDVPEGAWFTPYVEAAVRVELISGFEDGTFRPDDYITRAQACVIMNRTLDRHPDKDRLLNTRNMLVWPDNTPADWFYADMQEATNSHDYHMTTNEVDGEKVSVETWTKKLPQRDWAAFEHAWSDAHSSPFDGEVVDKK